MKCRQPHVYGLLRMVAGHFGLRIWFLVGSWKEADKKWQNLFLLWMTRP
jgi:hypothetical protein